MLDRAKAAAGIGGRRKQYLNLEHVEELHEVSDPATTEDETDQTWREWIGENRVLVIFFTLIGIAGLAAVAVWARRFAPIVATHPLVQGAVAVGGLVFVGYKLGFRDGKSTYGEIDEVDLLTEDSLTTFQGKIVETTGEDPYFIPIKGFSGRSPRFYTHADLGAELLKHPAKQGVDPDSPVVIRLHRTQAVRFDSELGTRFAQLTSGLEPEPWNPESTVHASAPDFGDDATIRRLHSELEETAADKKHYKELHSRMQRRLNHVMTKIEDTRAEVREEVREDVREMMLLARSRPDQLQRESDEDGGRITPAPMPGANGHSGGADGEIEAIDDELEEDNDEQ